MDEETYQEILESKNTGENWFDGDTGHDSGTDCYEAGLELGMRAAREKKLVYTFYDEDSGETYYKLFDSPEAALAAAKALPDRKTTSLLNTLEALLDEEEEKGKRGG